MVRNTLLVLTAFLVFLASCGIPREDRQRAEGLSKKAEELKTLVGVKQKEYAKSIVEAADYKEYKIYAEREGWANSSQDALAKITLAEGKVAQEIMPLLKQNDPKDAQKLREHVFAIEKLLSEAQALANRPFDRKAYIQNAKKNYARIVEDAGNALAKAAAVFSPLAPAADRAKLNFPDRAGDITKRFAPVAKLHEDAKSSYREAVHERNQAEESKFADFAKLADRAKVVHENSNKVREDAVLLKKQIESLSKSYTKTLVDMKAEYFIRIERFSWDDDADYPSVHEHQYPIQAISDELFDYFNKLPESTDKIAELRRGWNGDSMKFYIDEGKWNLLKITPRDNWSSSSDDTAEYTFTLSAKYFHKYAEEMSGVIATTAWIAVSEELFEDYVDDLGMDIISKPYGTFEEETLKEPAPAGMALVGNPRYGAWKTDSSGNSFWAFYGQYMFFSHLLGSTNPYYYQRGEWEHWNKSYRGKDGYYGEDKDKKERYGSRGYVTGSSPRYSKDISRFRNMSQRHGDSGSVGGRSGAGRTSEGGGSGK